ncbi:hypothetical protein JOQ06_013848, partial [Pogonophryne albipinna]
QTSANGPRMMTTKTAARWTRNLRKVPIPPNINVMKERTGSPAAKAAPPPNTPAGSRIPAPNPWSFSHLAANAGAPSTAIKPLPLEK